MTSNLEKKRSIKEGIEQLRSKTGWDPSSYKSKSPEEQFRELNQAQRTESAYEKGNESKCRECEKCCQLTNDPTALCETHLTEAMGF